MTTVVITSTADLNLGTFDGSLVTISYYPGFAVPSNLLLLNTRRRDTFFLPFSNLTTWRSDDSVTPSGESNINMTVNGKLFLVTNKRLLPGFVDKYVADVDLTGDFDFNLYNIQATGQSNTGSLVISEINVRITFTTGFAEITLQRFVQPGVPLYTWNISVAGILIKLSNLSAGVTGIAQLQIVRVGSSIEVWGQGDTGFPWIKLATGISSDDIVSFEINNGDDIFKGAATANDGIGIDEFEFVSGTIRKEIGPDGWYESKDVPISSAEQLVAVGLTYEGLDENNKITKIVINKDGVEQATFTNDGQGISVGEMICISEDVLDTGTFSGFTDADASIEVYYEGDGSNLFYVNTFSFYSLTPGTTPDYGLPAIRGCSASLITFENDWEKITLDVEEDEGYIIRDEDSRTTFKAVMVPIDLELLGALGFNVIGDSMLHVKHGQVDLAIGDKIGRGTVIYKVVEKREYDEVDLIILLRIDQV